MLEQSIIGNGKAGMCATEITTDEWVAVQHQDPVIYELLQFKKMNTFKASEVSCPEVKWMLKIRHQFVMWNQLLYCKIKPIHQDQPLLQFMLPTSHQTQAMWACYDDSGHLGIDCTLDLLQVISKLVANACTLRPSLNVLNYIPS